MCDTTKQREILFRQFDGVCFYCELKITFVNGTRDHFWPRAHGGWNGIHNLVLACSDCNNLKADRLPTLLEFYKLREYRPDLSVEHFHAPSVVPNTEKAKANIQRQIDRLARRRAAKAARHIAEIERRKNRAKDRREALFYSNLAGPIYSGTSFEGGIVRAYRGPAFPFKPISYLTVEQTMVS